MGCCLFAIFGAVWPRIALIVIWVFNGSPAKVFHTTLWPLLGFLFMPTTTLAYEVSLTYIGGTDNPWTLLILVVAVLHDLGQFGAVRRRRKK